MKTKTIINTKEQKELEERFLKDIILFYEKSIYDLYWMIQTTSLFMGNMKHIKYFDCCINITTKDDKKYCINRQNGDFLTPEQEFTIKSKVKIPFLNEKGKNR